MAILTARYLLIPLLVLSIKAEDTNSNVSLIEELRQPRTSGRVVKLYSGTKPEPILCAGEGFQADSKDCAIFYRCIKSSNGKYSVFKFQCGPGTVYDPDTEVCNHPRSTKRPECGGFKWPSSDTSYNHVNEIEEEQQEFPTPISTKLPIYTERTTTASFVATQSSSEQISFANYNLSGTSTKRQEQNAISFSTIYPITTNNLASFSVTTPSPVVLSVTEQSSLNDNICTFDGFIGDSDNCHKFYRCVRDHKGGYIKYEFLCSESTIWDEDVHACNHPWAVKRSRCGRNSVYSKNSSIANAIDIAQETTPQINPVTRVVTNKTVQQQVQTSYGSKLTQNQIQSSKAPAVQNQTQVNYSDEEDQTKYSSVNQNQTQISHDSAISQVQIQIKEENEVVQTQLQIDHLNEISQIQIQESSTNSTSNNNDSNVCTESGFMSDPYDCKKFYRCVNNGRGSYNRHEFSCSEGTVWDSGMEACNHEWLVKECGRKISSSPVTTEVLSASSINFTPSYDIMNTKTSHNYYSTSEITPTKAFEYGGYGSGSQDTTVSAIISMTTTAPDMIKSEENECKSSGFIGDTKDCKIFYRCVENDKGYTKYEFKCGEGTVWDPEIESCNHAWAVKKCGGGAPIESEKMEHATTSGTSTITLTSGYITQSDIQLIEQTVQQDDYDNGYGSHKDELLSTTIKSTNQQQVQDENETKECESSGFMPDKQNCKKFYRCVSSGNGSFTRYEFICGEGTIWDKQLESCNYEWAVKECGNKNISTSDFITSTVKSTQHDYSTSTTKTTIFYNITSETVPNANISQSTILETKPTHISPMQENECKTSGFMGDTKDCKIFYRCVQNGERGYTKYEFKCGDDTVWDPDIEACNHVWAVKQCGGIASIKNETIESTTTFKHTTITNTPTGQQIVPDDEYDTGYNSNGDKFSSTTIKTTIQPQVDDYYVTNECQGSGFMGDMHDCKKFYRCVDTSDGSYTRYEFTCGDGTVWDPKIQACNHVWAVENCGNTSETTEHAITSLTSTIINDEEVVNGYPQQHEEVIGQTIQNSTNSSTTKISFNALNNCKTSGFIGDKTNCKIFYRCVDDGKGGFIQHEFQCGEGTVWDYNIEACNHAWVVKTCGSGNNTNTNQTESTTLFDSTLLTVKTTTSSENYAVNESSANCKHSGFFGVNNDCKKFYRCIDNGEGGLIKHDFICGEGTYWNQNITACDHASPNQTCGQNESEQDEMFTSTATKPTTLFVTVGSQEISSVQTSQFKCESEGFYSELNDCNKFYRCIDNGNGIYTKYEFTCGDGTVWNQEIQACDYKSSDNKCIPVHSSTEIDGSQQDNKENNTTTTTTITQEQQSTDKSDTVTSSSNNRCESEGFHADSSDCKKFIRCVSNTNGGYTKYEFTCGEGTIWFQDIQACDHENGAKNCSSQYNYTIKPQATESQQTFTTSEIIFSTSTSQPQTLVKEDDEYESGNSKEPGLTSVDCSFEGFYGDPNDCKRFYRCVDNNLGGYIKYDFSCGEGTAWDGDIQACNLISQVRTCNNNSVTQDSQMQPIMHDEEISQTTENISTTKSSSNDNASTQDACEKEGYYGNTKNCKLFYRCVDDGNGGFTKYDYSCGDGTIWDQDITVCNHPHDVVNASCSQEQVASSTSSISSTTSSITSSTSDSEIYQSTISTTKSSGQTSQNCTQDESSNKPVNKNITCDKAGYYPDPNDCKKFYRCVDWDGDGKRFSVYYFDCGEGTIWDPAVETCNHEESVYPPRDCSGAQSQNENMESTTTPDKITTMQSTTSDETAGKEPTTQQTTTVQSTISEQSTAQQSTITETSTTQQSSTSDQTTQESSTTTQSTTQQSINTEKSTTQQLSTIEQTTTQQPTSSEHTTQQTSTASEETSIKPSTSSEQTTTDQTTKSTNSNGSTTTEEPMTTESSTVSEGTSTEPYTTSQQTTTDQTTATSTTDSSNTTGSTSTTTQSSDSSSTTEYQQETTTNETSNKECPDTDDDQNLFACPTSFRRHPKYCNVFYQCTEDDDSYGAKIAVFNCPNNTIYDESKIQCVEEDKADKPCKGEIATTRRFKRVGENFKEPIVVTRDSQTCPDVGHMAFEKNSECSPAFLKCEKTNSGTLRGFVYQCPEGYTYWSISRRCERNDNVINCKRTSNNWNNRWEIPVERNNVAW